MDTNIVLGQFNSNGQTHILRVPDGKRLEKGDNIIVDIGPRNADAVCCCKSFRANEDAVEALRQMYGQSQHFPVVVGKLTVEDWTEEDDVGQKV